MYRFTLERLVKAHESGEIGYHEVSRHSGLSPATVFNVLNGKVPNPRAKTLVALCNAIGFDPADLFVEET
jgi:DNA-binding Xre family transcriptional regulator